MAATLIQGANEMANQIIEGTHGRTYIIDDAGVAHRFTEDNHVCDYGESCANHVCEDEQCCWTEEERDEEHRREMRIELASSYFYAGGDPQDAFAAADMDLEMGRQARLAEEQADREYAAMDRVYTRMGLNKEY
jgi:hypothetical protein